MSRLSFMRPLYGLILFGSLSNWGTLCVAAVNEDQASAGCKDLSDQLSALEGKFGDLRQKLHQTQQRATTFEKRYDDSEKSLTEANSIVRKLSDALIEYESNLKSLRAEKEQCQKTVTTTQQSFQKCTAKADSLTARLGKATEDSYLYSAEQFQRSRKKFTDFSRALVIYCTGSLDRKISQKTKEQLKEQSRLLQQNLLLVKDSATEYIVRSTHVLHPYVSKVGRIYSVYGAPLFKESWRATEKACVHSWRVVSHEGTTTAQKLGDWVNERYIEPLLEHSEVLAGLIPKDWHDRFFLMGYVTVASFAAWKVLCSGASVFFVLVRVALRVGKFLIGQFCCRKQTKRGKNPRTNKRVGPLLTTGDRNGGRRPEDSGGRSGEGSSVRKAEGSSAGRSEADKKRAASGAHKK